ncbi:hypothetical protein [Citrobacter braakii]
MAIQLIVLQWLSWSVGNEVFYNNLIFDKIMPLMVNSSLMAFFGRLNASDAEKTDVIF